MKKLVLLSLMSAFTSSASAAVVSLDFEGISDQAPVGNFYNGGAGVNYGVEFSPDTLALIDQDAGGIGNFANEPSPNTVMFFLNSQNAILNYAAGFDTGISFFYSSSLTASVNVYDDVNGGGNLIASLNLSPQNTNNCSGDPTGVYCNWSAVGVEFNGIAKSVNFGGTANRVGFDNITFGSSTPVTSVPEPETYAMLLAGLGLIGFSAQRRKASQT